MKSKIIAVAKYILGFSILIVLVDFQELCLPELTLRNIAYLVMAFLLVVLNLMIQAIRWSVLVKRHVLTDLNIRDAIKLNWRSYFYSLLGAGSLGADGSRVFLLKNKDKSAQMNKIVMSVTFDRIMGLLVMILMMSLAAPQSIISKFTSMMMSESYSDVIKIGSFAIIASVLAHIIIKRRYAKLKTVLFCFVLSVLASLSLISSAQLIMVSFDQPVSYIVNMFSIPMVAISNSIPITPGGIGLGEFTGHQAYNYFGISMGAQVVFLQRIFVIFSKFPGFFIRSN